MVYWSITPTSLFSPHLFLCQFIMTAFCLHQDLFTTLWVSYCGILVYELPVPMAPFVRVNVHKIVFVAFYWPAACELPFVSQHSTTTPIEAYN